MSADQFIDALEANGVLPSSTADKLRKKVAAGGAKPLTAKSLARFLIEKGLASKQDIMSALAAGGEIKPVSPAPAADPSGIQLPMDELQDMSSSSEWAMEESSGGFADPAAESPAESKSAKGKKKKKKGRKDNEWDSPLLLIGGGSLVLMIIVGTLIWYILFAENADKVLLTARDAMQSGSYGNAIANYEKFIADYPNNAEFNQARVELAMARIRNLLETGGPEPAFDIAEVELREVSGKPDFHRAEEDLSDLLPRIARGLADKAEKSEGLEETQKTFDKAKTALGWTNTTKYIPKSRRDTTELEGIRETLDRIERRQQSLTDLEETLAAMETAVSDGQTSVAFTAQEELLEKHPALIGNERLAEALAKISAAEQQNIRFVEEPVSAQAGAEAGSVVAALAVANRRVPGTSPAAGPICVQVNGAAYGVDAASGSVLWRKYTGPSLTPTNPVSIGSDVLLLQWRAGTENKPQQTLMRVELASGNPVWRLVLDDEVAAPVVAGEDVLLAGASGKLYVVDGNSGGQKGFAQFAQPLRISPAVNPQTNVAYVVGERSSVYTISLADYSCLGVFYSNHDRGAIVAPPAVVLDKVLVAQNEGSDTSKIRLYSTETNGALSRVLKEERVTGRVVTQPMVEGRRVTLVTDRGEVAVYDVSVGAEGEPMTLLASRASRSSQPAVRYALVQDGNIWLAENALSKYTVAPAGNRLTVSALEDDFNRSQYVAPLQVRDGVLFHTRARRRFAGFTVAASNVGNGAPMWETDIGAPPADNPLASTDPVALLLADANGQVFRFDPNAIRTRVQNEALPQPAEETVPTIYQYGELLSGGAAVFASPGVEHVLLYSPSGAQPLAKVALPSPLACRPTAVGEGWIAPLSVGQVFALDAKSGKPLAAPFQPPLEAGRSVEWKPAYAIDESQTLITDGVAKVYLLDLEPGGALTTMAEANLSVAPLASGFVAVDGAAVALAETGQLVVYQLPSLEPGEPVNPGASVLWGPFRAGGVVLAATAENLLAVDGTGKVVWQVPLNVAKLAGPPLVVGEQVFVASQDGTVLKLNLTDGSELGRMDAGEPIAAGPVLLNNRVVVAAEDSTLLVLETP
jgi:outer membrane protein assembly factor BamB/tetratricopeptide (TPR) repeat protein